MQHASHASCNIFRFFAKCAYISALNLDWGNYFIKSVFHQHHLYVACIESPFAAVTYTIMPINYPIVQQFNHHLKSMRYMARDHTSLNLEFHNITWFALCEAAILNTVLVVDHEASGNTHWLHWWQLASNCKPIEAAQSRSEWKEG
jgi:hypothetical protein